LDVIAVALIIICQFELEKLNPLGGINWDFFKKSFFSIEAALIILFSVELFHRIRSRRFKNFFLLFGGLSMYLWFLHGIFFTGKNFLQPFIYSPKEPILILLLCLAVTLPVAWLLKSFQTYLNSKIFKA
jgi:peptidoglycan/LPS O-acetylase OafA/YrhL